MNFSRAKKFNEAIWIIKVLQKHGYETYLAGGCVRDILMGNEPKDYDISTSAKPEEIEEIFAKTKAVGKKFGVILILGKTGHFEASTFRGEEEYLDKRRPSKVFWVSAKEDAKRRDFTVNGLFYDPIKKKLIDYVDGEKDIKAKIIRFIGQPDKRIKEDNLRLLRAIRFKNILGFNHEPAAEKAIVKNAFLIKNVSSERIKKELDLLLEDRRRADGISDLSRLGILEHILPEIEKMKGVKQPPEFHAEGDVFEHTILSLKKLPEKTSKEIAWATFLHDIGKPGTAGVKKVEGGERIIFYGHTKLSAEITEKICRRLKFSKKEREKVVFLVREHLRHKDIMKMKTAKQRRWAQEPWFSDLLAVWKADGEASYLDKKGKIDLSLYDYALKLFQEELKRPRLLKPLLDGHQIMKILKIPAGPKIGQILEKLLDAQLEGKIKTKEEAMKFIGKMI